jgi:hypothetical protein
LSVTYELFNGRKETIHAQLSSQVSARDGAVVATLRVYDFFSGFDLKKWKAHCFVDIFSRVLYIVYTIYSDPKL